MFQLFLRLDVGASPFPKFSRTTRCSDLEDLTVVEIRKRARRKTNMMNFQSNGHFSFKKQTKESISSQKYNMAHIANG